MVFDDHYNYIIELNLIGHFELVLPCSPAGNGVVKSVALFFNGTLEGR
jgi:hypothetical protein